MLPINNVYVPFSKHVLHTFWNGHFSVILWSPLATKRCTTLQNIAENALFAVMMKLVMLIKTKPFRSYWHTFMYISIHTLPLHRHLII